MVIKAICAALLAALGLVLGGPVPQESEPRFGWVDLYLDPAGERLAAWQLELDDPAGRSLVVGIEGGEHPAFAEPAYYDPAAMRGGRVILAAFSLAEELPAGRTRVARVHLEIRGPEPLESRVRLLVAGGPGGEPITAAASAVAGGL